MEEKPLQGVPSGQDVYWVTGRQSNQLCVKRTFASSYQLTITDKGLVNGAHEFHLSRVPSAAPKAPRCVGMPITPDANGNFSFRLTSDWSPTIQRLDISSQQPEDNLWPTVDP